MEQRTHEHLSAERLQAFLEGELPAGEVGPVEAHLAGCSRCTEELDTWRVLFHDLSALPQHLPSRGFGERVIAAVERPERLSLVARLRRRAGAFAPQPLSEHVASERLQDLLDGDLPARHVARVRAHVDTCAACTGELDAWRGVYARLSALDGFAPAPGFAERVLARLRAAPAVTRVPAWRRALATAGRFVPKTRRAWAAISGIAVTPAVTGALVLYTVFSHPTLTLQALSSFVIWKLTDVFTAAWGVLSTAALDAGQLVGLGSFVNALIDAPWAVAGGALAYSVLSVLALRVLYKNLLGGRRYARLSIQ
jgi:anti-sigma factor RsiW